ncbi:uncharacterized protein TRAVEDRAFT_116239 [Trametes versicolor FP-101664 SS1]|uniref:uncharacterized protein n=1 Tax=Trametes versicolor (strain FP-101664) TaxID=717944 RepID=UPI0004624552|nr:uncharacterized protein TRAVEDRAFT_116239 [Trametes versicolor FP-101664 SS1]EIW62289.1 hypothetical protein TRAVEDRAFT_116239 [Trametes versicolor FP-101664 SS1]
MIHCKEQGSPTHRSLWVGNICYRLIRSINVVSGRYGIFVHTAVYSLHQGDAAKSGPCSINQWILEILMFHFNLVHIPGTSHGLMLVTSQPRTATNLRTGLTVWVHSPHGTNSMLSLSFRGAAL